ncbi:cofilin family protein [Streptomyces sp. NPDC048566]|uniref:cofilin family protein n=1 Tax=Streptomyces sp. NPDC048566 TaxID=3365569 RepID=UPI0037153F83
MSQRIAVDAHSVQAFRDVETDPHVNVVVYRLADATDSCTVERRGNLRHEELVRALPPDEPRIVAYDLAFATVDGARRHRVLLISWIPGTVPPRRTVRYLEGYAAVRAAVDGDPVPIAASRGDDLDYHRLVSLARRRRRDRPGGP